MSESRHRYGQATLVCVVIAGMVGAGVFTTSGFSLQSLGSPLRVMLAWGLGGAIALCGAVAYGGLAARMPESGGEYLYLSRQLHPFAGFLTGWVSLTAGFSGAIALAAVTFEHYVVTDVWRPDWLRERMTAMTVVIICGLAHSFHTRQAAIIQNVIVMIKLAALAVFLLMAMNAATTAGWHLTPLPADAGQEPSASSHSPMQFWFALATSVMWISLSYAGFNAAVYVASEVRDAAVLVPRALLTGTLVTTLLYLLLNFVFVTAAPAQQLAGQPDVAAVAAKAIGGSRLEILIRMTIGLATFSSVASMIMTGPRVYGKMADDGLLPGWFRNSPQQVHRTVLLQTGLAILLIQTATLRQLLSYLGTTLSLSSAVTVATLLFCRQEIQVGRIQQLSAGLYALATVLFVVLMSIADPRHLFGALITVITGVVLWIGGRRLIRLIRGRSS